MVGNMSNGALVAILAILTLVVGVFAGAFLFPKTVVDNSKVVQMEESLAKSKEQIVSLEKSLAESVAEIKAIEEEKEVIGEVKVVEKDYLADAVATFLIAVEDEEVKDGINKKANKVDILGNYSFEEMTVRKVLNDYKVEIDKDKTVIEFNIKLKFKEDGETSLFEDYNVKVIEYTDEDKESKVIANKIL